MRQHLAFGGRAGQDRGQVRVPGEARRVQVRERHPVGPQHARVAPGQRYVTQVRGPAERRVAYHQELTAPRRAVVPVAGAVEGDADHLLVPAQTVLRHDRRDVRVVVLHGAHGPPRRTVAGPVAGPVAGMAVRDQQRGHHPGEFFEVPLRAGQGVDRGQVVHVADVLAQPGIAALAQGAGVLQVRAHGERRRYVEGQRERQRGIPA